MRILVSGATKTMRRIANKYPRHLGQLITPVNRNSMSSMLGIPWAADNGAFA